MIKKVKFFECVLFSLTSFCIKPNKATIYLFHYIVSSLLFLGWDLTMRRLSNHPVWWNDGSNEFMGLIHVKNVEHGLENKIKHGEYPRFS